MASTDIGQQWLLSVKMPVVALAILLCLVPCSGLSMNCSEPTQPALLSALNSVFKLNAIRPVMNMSTPTNVTMHFTMYGILGVLQKAEGSSALTAIVDRFGGVTVDLAHSSVPEDISEDVFSGLLHDSLVQWRAEEKVAVWLRIPVSLSRCAAAASTQGFTFHHAKAGHSVMALWLGEGESRLPGFATHQVGVAGAVVDESNGKVLVVQDKNKTKNAWKFPGGLSDPGEDIGATAVREVFEETGVRSQFRSLLSIRQQHNHPGAFGMSDLYLICRLSPLSYHINFCPQECLRCEWLHLEELAKTSDTTPITSRVARLLLDGLEHGFNHIDLTMEEMPAVYSGMFYQLYHRPLQNNQA